MTPKEKARELRDKMYLRIPSVYDPKGTPHYPIANEMALIAVDEILKSNPCYEDSDRGGNFRWNDNTYYWQEVKEELIKL